MNTQWKQKGIQTKLEPLPVACTKHLLSTDRRCVQGSAKAYVGLKNGKLRHDREKANTAARPAQDLLRLLTGLKAISKHLTRS